MRDQALIRLEERQQGQLWNVMSRCALPSAGPNRAIQTLPANSFDGITCVSDNFWRKLDMLSPYQSEKLTS